MKLVNNGQEREEEKGKDTIREEGDRGTQEVEKREENSP